nr:DUF4251 domain-containing protein [Allomuricauda sp.]
MKKVCIGVLTIILLGCGTAKTKQINEVEKQALDTMVENGKVEINAEWARPILSNSLNSIANAGLIPPGNTVSRINLIGNAAYLRIIGDSVSAYLPYYGERQMITSFGNRDNAIQFEGTPKDFEWKEDDKSKGYQLTFNIDNDTETYTVSARIFPGMYGMININSTHRQAINYTGGVKQYTEE